MLARPGACGVAWRVQGAVVGAGQVSASIRCGGAGGFCGSNTLYNSGAHLHMK